MIRSPILDAQAGDVWLFSRQGFYNRIISLKTWSRFTHVESVVMQAGQVFTFTSRNGQGVNLYAPDLSGLALVLRLRVPFDQVPALRWAQTVLGQGYSYVGLLAFFWAKYQGLNDTRQFCSEAVTRYLRHGGADLFPRADADTIPPSYFAVSPFLDVVWRSEDEWRRYYDTPKDAQKGAA